jgi:hypothetical protein
MKGRLDQNLAGQDWASGEGGGGVDGREMQRKLPRAQA